MVYAALGGGAGLAASVAAFQGTLGPYRELFSLVGLFFLALAHYRYWLHPGGRGTRTTQVVLWLSTILTVFVVVVFDIWKRE